ncbi:DUF3105 domain-containing protein [Glycomyces sp. NPDC046736]|uniref:DUF3105 domain-containing protein n=1 Tax=Glycomyces sp. NPDC046736 TaxID=3155615 RepID=UPI0033DB71C2
MSRIRHCWTAAAAALALASAGGCALVEGDAGEDDGAPSQNAEVSLEGVESFYGEYDGIVALKTALAEGEIAVTDLEHPWITQQEHVDGLVGWDGEALPYELHPPAGGNHLSQWQTCTGSVYDGPLVDGYAVHSMEHGAVWLTYDPELLDQASIDALALLIDKRDYSLMSPYPGQGVAVSLQSWGHRYQTEDAADPVIEAYLDEYVLNERFNPEPNATCAGGITATFE